MHRLDESCANRREIVLRYRQAVVRVPGEPYEFAEDDEPEELLRPKDKSGGPLAPPYLRTHSAGVRIAKRARCLPCK